MSPSESVTTSSVPSSDNAGTTSGGVSGALNESLGHVATVFLIDMVKALIKEYKKIQRKNIDEINEITRDFGNPRLLWEYYVQPKCQTNNPADSEHSKQELVYEAIKSFLQNGMDSPNHMFILADAGMGKTSLLKMLKWTSLLTRFGQIKLWPKEYDCKLLKLGTDTLDRIESQNWGPSNTILLLDSLDEDPEAWGNIDARLNTLLEATKKFRRVFISCRTQFFPDTPATSFGNPSLVTVGNFTCNRIFLSAFDGEQVAEYLSKCFPDSLLDKLLMRQNERRIEADQLLKSMQDLMFRPLLLSYIKLFPRRDENEIWDGYRVFDALTDQWLQQEAQKLEKKGINFRKQKLREICVAIAVNMQLSNQRVISKEELEKIINDKNIINGGIDALDFGGRSLMNRTSDGKYRFSHYTIQEFLVVYAIVENFEKNSMSKVRVTAQMLEFLRCCLDRINVPKLLELLDLSDIKPSQLAGWLFFRESLDGNCSDLKGPEMALIPGGEFIMGSCHDEQGHEKNEYPQIEMKLKLFAMSRYAVTFEDYDFFCKATQRAQPNDQGWGRGLRPVINITYEDAVAYCDWLSAKTGAPYRLPSEAEWEYAARAWTKTPFWWGDQIDTTMANYNGKRYSYGVQKTNLNSYREKTLSVDALQNPNPFGLYQVHGNVWEWVEDFWHENYENVPRDGSAWMGDPWMDQHGNTRRVARGGSFNTGPNRLRSAAREGIDPSLRAEHRGFRLARTLTL